MRTFPAGIGVVSLGLKVFSLMVFIHVSLLGTHMSGSTRIARDSTPWPRRRLFFDFSRRKADRDEIAEISQNSAVAMTPPGLQWCRRVAAARPKTCLSDCGLREHAPCMRAPRLGVRLGAQRLGVRQLGWPPLGWSIKSAFRHLGRHWHPCGHPAQGGAWPQSPQCSAAGRLPQPRPSPAGRPSRR